MRNRNEIVTPILFIIIILSTSGCISYEIKEKNDEEINNIEPIIDNTEIKREISLELCINDIIINISDPNDAVHVPVSLKISWNGTNNWTGTYPSEQKYDFYVIKNESIIWNWAKGKMFAQVIIPFSINYTNPIYFNETLSFSIKNAEDGIYIVRGFFTATRQSVQKQIVIKTSS